MTDGQLVANIEQYLQAVGLNVPPPPITSDPLVTGGVPIEQLLRILGIAANAGDPADNEESIDQHADREAKLRDAAAKFAAQDDDATGQLNNVADQGAAQMAQQMPQLASGIASSLGGALSGIFQPMAQIPQQMAQGAQQAMQAAMGMAPQFGGSAGELPPDTMSEADLADEFGSHTAEIDAQGGGSSGGGGGGAGLGLTAPTAMLGPPHVPSAATAPSSSPTVPVPPVAAATPSSAHPSGMAGMPMMPPGAMRPGDTTHNEPKPDSKRLSVPTVKNGAPVQGRITTPPPAPQVVKKADGGPVATKRIAMPTNKIIRNPDVENQQRS